MNTQNLLDKYFETAFSAPDGIKRLRELILSLAMQGKLVPQDPNDQPARDLLREIEAEKQRLVKAGKIKKQKPLPPIQPEEIPYELPESWEWVRLGNITEIIRGITFPSDAKSKEDTLNRIPCLRTSNVQQEIEWEDLLYIETKYIKRDDQIICNDDIVMSMANSKELVGKVAIIKKLTHEKVTFGGFLSVIRVHQILPYFILNFLRSNDTRNKLIDSSSQTTNIANISLAKLNPILVPVSPLIEQKRIVEKIESLMAQCDELEKRQQEREQKRILVHTSAVQKLLNAPEEKTFGEAWQFIKQNFGELYAVKENVSELRKAILQLSVMGKLVPQDPNDPPASELLKEITAEKQRLMREHGLKTQAEIHISRNEEYINKPKGWVFYRLGNLAKFIDYRGKTPKKISSGIPLITAKNVRFGFIDREPYEYVSEEEYSSWMTRGFPRLGDLLFTTEAPLGNIAIVDINERFALAQRVICFQLHKPEMNSYLRLLIMSNIFQEQLINNATGMTAKGIKASKLKEIPIPIPPLPEQHRIVAKVDALMTLCDQLENQIDQQTAKQTQLLSAVMAGV